MYVCPSGVNPWRWQGAVAWGEQWLGVSKWRKGRILRFYLDLRKNKMDALTTRCLIIAACVYHVKMEDKGMWSFESRALLVRKVAFFSVAAWGTWGCTVTALMSVAGLIIDRKDPESMPFRGAASLTVWQLTGPRLHNDTFTSAQDDTQTPLTGA